MRIEHVGVALSLATGLLVWSATGFLAVSPALAQEAVPPVVDPKVPGADAPGAAAAPKPSDPAAAAAKPAEPTPAAAAKKAAESRPGRKPLVISPKTAPLPERPGDGRLGETAPPVPHQPGFVAPLTRSTGSGRVGVAGWTAPNVPTGSAVAGAPDHAGSFGFGIAAEWNGPPRPKPRVN